MKLNKKGFMLAEVTVVASLAASVMLLMYASSVKTINAYKERENYYDVDTIYATGYIYDYIIDNNAINTYISNARSNDDSIKYNKKDLPSNSQIEKISNNYGVTDIRFVLSKSDEINKLSDNVTRRTFKNYLNNYVKKNVSDADNDKYMLIIEREVGKNYYYYSVEV